MPSEGAYGATPKRVTIVKNFAGQKRTDDILTPGTGPILGALQLDRLRALASRAGVSRDIGRLVVPTDGSLSQLWSTELRHLLDRPFQASSCAYRSDAPDQLAI